MNFFQKNNIIIWILTGLLIAALSAVGTMAYHHWLAPAPVSTAKPCSGNCDLLSEELGLTAEQQKKIGEIRMNCRNTGMAISDSLRSMRSELLTELSKELPDTIQLRLIADRIGKLQAQLTNRTIDQYLKISKECTPEQREKLSSLYFEMMGCSKHDEAKGMKNRCMKE
jgi:Spy/CpxP family protein refolding chaperone